MDAATAHAPIEPTAIEIPVKQAPAQQSPARRCHEIDGLRGWACTSVMLSHLFHGVFLHVDPPFIPPIWRYILMEPLLAGEMAVAVFFILSGDVLSAPYWVRPSRIFLVRQTVKRWVRLTVPVLAGSTIVFAMIKTGLTFNHEAAPLLHEEGWLGLFLRGDFSVFDLLRFSGLTVYFEVPAQRSLLPFLWTMRIEMLGSMLLLVYLFADDQIRRRFAAMIFMLVICLTADSMLACFPIGMLCALARARGGFDWLQRQKPTEPIALVAFTLALVVGGLNRVWEGFFLPSIIAGSVVVISVYASHTLTRFFSTSLSRWLGQVSFPIFVLHFPVMISFTSGMALLALQHGMLSPAMMWLIVTASAALCIVVSRLFLPVETFSGRAGNWTCDLMMQPETQQPASPQSAG